MEPVMMKSHKLRTLAAVLLSLILASPAIAADRVTWRWSKDASGCSLSQKLESSVTAVDITRTPGMDETVIGWRVRTPKFTTGYYPDSRVVLEDGTSFPAAVRVYSTPLRDYSMAVDVDGRAFLKALGANRWIAVENARFGRFDAPIRDAGAAGDALAACEDKMLRGWDIDPAQYWALQARPKPIGQLSDLFTGDNYPGVGLSKNIESLVIARMEIGTDGRVSSCVSPGHHDYPQFVAAVCDVLTRDARFTPAMDAGGRAVAAPYVTYARFRIAGY
jgi:hypothetical protein